MLRSTITPGDYVPAPGSRGDSRRPRSYSQKVPANSRLPWWAWMLPATTAVAAVLVWTIRGGTQRGTWVGAVLIAATGLLVYALALEALPHDRRGFVAAIGRGVFAVFLGLAAGAATLLAAGLGYYLEYRPFG
jgi:hypothetical protein